MKKKHKTPAQKEAEIVAKIAAKMWVASERIDGRRTIRSVIHWAKKMNHWKYNT